MKFSLTLALYFIIGGFSLSYCAERMEELFRMNDSLNTESEREILNNTGNLNSEFHTHDQKLPFNETITIQDIDGNIYSTVKIGRQIWMASNLKTSSYNDGTRIPEIPENSLWADQQKGAYCWYNNDSVSFDPQYGKLYNWYAVETDKLCPTGWRVPDYSDWIEIMNYLGGRNFAGGKMKSTVEKYWTQPSTGATNESGFSAIATGYRNSKGEFYELGRFARWWSTTEGDSKHAFGLGIYFGYGTVLKNNNHKSMGYAVRCIKDY